VCSLATTDKARSLPLARVASIAAFKVSRLVGAQLVNYAYDVGNPATLWLIALTTIIAYPPPAPALCSDWCKGGAGQLVGSHSVVGASFDG
jgi:hypothetical protein